MQINTANLQGHHMARPNTYLHVQTLARAHTHTHVLCMIKQAYTPPPAHSPAHSRPPHPHTHKSTCLQPPSNTQPCAQPRAHTYLFSGLLSQHLIMSSLYSWGISSGSVGRMCSLATLCPSKALGTPATQSMSVCVHMYVCGSACGGCLCLCVRMCV